MSVPRQDATGTLLNDGTVLITGGAVYGTPGTYYSSAEIFHSNTGTFELLGSQMSSLRTSHAATKLTDGRVLITGGSYRDANNTYFTVKKADLYDPSTKTFTPVNDTLLPRERHTSTLLQDGRVLIAGGFGAGREAETYDPITFTFTATTQQMLPGSGSGGQTATLLADGRVLLTGGYGTFGMATTIAQFFDPIAGSFSSAGNLLSPRSLHTATTLANGNILIAAGQNDGACCTAQPGSASVEIYVPGTGFSPAGSLLATRYQHRASVVGSKVLFTGTWGWSAIAGQSGELYDPAITIGLANANFPDGTSGQAYGPLALQGFGGTPTYTVTLASGALPPGLSLTNNAIGGTPTASGTFSFSLSIADSASHSATQAFSIRIDAIVITTASFPTAYVGVPYLTGFSATGVGATTWSLVPNSGSPPPGLTLHANGTIDGTPLQTGFYNFRVQAVDSIGQATQVSRAISVVQPLQITTAYMDDPVPLWNYGWCLGANGGSGPRTWSVVGGTLAPGLSLGANGCFTGQPVKTGSFTFSVQVTDGVQPSTPVQFTHHVGTVDQAVWNIDPQPAPPAIAFGGGVELAQVFKTQMAGVLFGMGFPVACDPNVGLHLEIRGVTAGQPNASVLATSDFPAARVGAFTGPIYYRDLPLTTPLSVTRLTNLAAVLSAPGTCRVTAAQADTQSFTNSNPFGDAFTGSTGSWTALSTSDPTRPDVPFFSFVSDGGVLDFMSTGRNEGTATILPTGSNAGLVLLAGGYTETTQLYNPTTQTINGVLSGRFAASGSLTHLRAHHTATVLPDGWVLVVGGRDDTTGLSTAELYNPNSGTWSSTGQMSTARQGHTATLLSGNRVLIAGGQVDWFAPGLSSTEIFQYDPSTHTGQFSAGPSMAVGRAQHQAVTLNDARVLFSGGWGATLNATAELFTDSGAGSFGPTAGAMQTARADHTATLLSNGKVLIAGGWQIFVNAAAQTGELFDPQTNTFANVGANAARRNHLAARLNDGRVVLAGGDDGAGNPLFTVDVFDPVAATFATAHELVVARGGITGTHLANDKVLAVGGYGPSSTVWQSSELLDPANLFGAAVLPPLDGVAPPKPFAVTLNARAEERAVWSGPACRAPDAEGFRPPAFGTAAVGFTAPVLIDVAVGESPPQQQY